MNKDNFADYEIGFVFGAFGFTLLSLRGEPAFLISGWIGLILVMLFRRMIK